MTGAIFQDFHFFGLFTLDNRKFLKAVKLLLDNPVKLFFGDLLETVIVSFWKKPFVIVPGFLIGIVEVALRWKFPTSFNLIFDICNDVNFILVFLLGYGLAAADDHGIKEVIKKGRWYNLVAGTCTNPREFYKKNLQTRPGVDKVKPKGWFKYSLQID